jgi:hypothetical protein
MVARTKAFVIGAAVLTIAIAAMPASNRKPEAAAPPSPAPAVPAATAPAGDPSPIASQLAEQRKRSATLAFGRDPFAPTRGAVEPPADHETPPPPTPKPASGPAPAAVKPPNLTGASESGAVRFAIIDEAIVHEGEQLASGYTVETIASRSVTLLRGNERLCLHIGGDQ